jgi:predicted nuclease of predicted toxin-antitoxin system
MRFLIDRCAGRRIAEFLKQQGHDVSEVAERKSDPGDIAILQWASDENRILVTMDKDFGRLVYLENRTHSGIIRLPDVRSPQRSEIMKRILEAHSINLAEGCMITIRGDRIRISFSEGFNIAFLKKNGSCFRLQNS